ncbi:MAG: cytidine deaminase [Ignavibacteriae bacterium]|nr:MAG: cytidine deaminase [Ignavibacteriota bacterium]
MSSNQDNTALIEQAINAMQNSHCPHSGFRVGAALMSSSGKIYPGTNVEFDAFSLTVCAERSALFNAVSNGDKKFVKIAISTNSENFKFPCGLCRQALVEFSPELEIILVNVKKEQKIVNLRELLPNFFKL